MRSGLESSAGEAVDAAAAAESSAGAQVGQAGSCASAGRDLASSGQRVRAIAASFCWVVQTQRAVVSVQAAGVCVSSSAGQPCSVSWGQ